MCDKSSLTNIISSCNNIQPLNLDCAVTEGPLLAKLLEKEVANVVLEGFKIQRMQRVLKNVQNYSEHLEAYLGLPQNRKM